MPQVWKIGLPMCVEALLAVADLAGGHWSETARVAAVTDVTESKRRTPSLLLRDIRAIFDDLGKDRLSTVQVLTDLGEMGGLPVGHHPTGRTDHSTGSCPGIEKYGNQPGLSAWLSWC